MFARQTLGQGVGFGLTPDVVPIALWQSNEVNKYEAQGRLTLDDLPVAGARLRADGYTLPEPTGANGEFRLRRDQTVLVRTVVRVADAAGARVGDRPLSEEQIGRLLGAEAAVATAFTIALDQEPQLRRGDQNVALAGTLTFSDGTTPVPAVSTWGYLLSGIVRNSVGDPVAEAVVSVSDDEGETWSLSTRTDETGEYLLRFFPTEDNAFTVRLAHGAALYASAQPVHFLPLTSSSLEIPLPDQGTELRGEAPDGALIANQIGGAEYVGIMIGLASGGEPVAAQLTWPDESGRFVVTIPVVDFAGPVAFYQAQQRFFTAEAVAPGAVVPETVRPSQLAPNVPQGLRPIAVQG